MIILRCVVQKLYVAKNFIPPGQSIANLRYNKRKEIRSYNGMNT